MAVTRVIASQGLAAATATIAKEAGVSDGSLFVCFDTKAALLNAPLGFVLALANATAGTTIGAGGPAGTFVSASGPVTW